MNKFTLRDPEVERRKNNEARVEQANRLPACSIRRPAGQNGTSLLTSLAALLFFIAQAIPVGGSPTGAGESPAPPILETAVKSLASLKISGGVLAAEPQAIFRRTL